MDNLLYYPYINIPKTPWSARALLYYDNIGAIVPQSYFYNPEEYDPYMRQMVHSELVIPINPMESLDNPWEICQPFLAYINGLGLNLIQRRNYFQSSINNGTLKRRYFSGYSRIHSNKFDGEIFYQLIELGLAKRESDEWYLVEPKTARELMVFLATILGKKLDYLPVTDRTDYNSRNSTLVQNYVTIKNEEYKRNLILDELIPFPEQINLSKLREFKDNHLDLLKAFKNKIELIVLNPSIEVNSMFFSETIRELNLRKTELSSKMNESKIGKIFYGSVCGIVGAIIGLASGTTPAAVLGGLPGFASAIYSALQLERDANIFDQSGMKYLALLDKKIRLHSIHSI